MKYKVKITPEIRKILKKYWLLHNTIYDEYIDKRNELESQMEKETGIQGIEFFSCGNEVVGIGNYGFWTMPLVDGMDL